MSLNQALSLDAIKALYSNGMLFEGCPAEKKTRMELRMIKLSASIRPEPNWTSQINDDIMRQEWAARAKNDFNLTDKHVEYVFTELEHYVQLMSECVGGEMLAGVDSVWISDNNYGNGFKRNVAKLENDCISTLSNDVDSSASSKNLQVLLDPFMYPFMAEKSFIASKPFTSPQAALDFDLPKIVPGSIRGWVLEINRFNKCQSNNDTVALFDSRELSDYIKIFNIYYSKEEFMCWLPTDFYINKDGSVAIKSYINNLHPTRHAALYHSIASVFAGFVPLLEQVSTDMLHPRQPRVIVDKEMCFKRNVSYPWEYVVKGSDNGLQTEKYQKFEATYPHSTIQDESSYVLQVDGKEYEMDELRKECLDAIVYTEPEPLPFAPSDRPTVPYSLHGMSLQASVEIAGINLTPENPVHQEGGWQVASGRAECIFAVGYYFYDVENIVSSTIMIRDPVKSDYVLGPEEFVEFGLVYDIDEDMDTWYSYSQPVGGVDIKNGRYICIPNMYQTKMPTFELADKTKNGHVKYAAFYIVDPSTRLVSTELVPPQQPSWPEMSLQDDWALANHSDHSARKNAIIKREILESYMKSNQQISGWFCVEINPDAM